MSGSELLSQAAVDRFWSRVDKAPTCWLWRGRIYYGFGWYTTPREDGHKDLRADHVAYSLLRDPVPHGQTLKHLCGNRACVRPDHVALIPRTRRRPPDPQALAERFWARVEWSEGCWPWLGSTTHDGYGRVSVYGRLRSAPAVAYELAGNVIPPGHEIDHLCRTPVCVNPAHLEAVTRRVNTLRGKSFAAVNAAKTHCPKGHPYDDENTHRNRAGGRDCRACRAAA